MLGAEQVRLAGSALGRYRHVCGFFANKGNECRYDDVVCYTYSLSRISASIMMDAIRVHPAVIIGGILQEDPFYVPPEEFLRELRARQPMGSDTG
jgi:hypothetical protein